MSQPNKTGTKSSPPDFSRITRIATFITLLCGAAFLSLGTLVDSVHVPLTYLRLNSEWCLIIGTVAVVAGVFCQWSRWTGMAFLTCMLSAFALTAIAITWQPAKQGQMILRPMKSAQLINSTEDFIDEHVVADAEYAFRGMSNKAVKQITKDFEVVYHHDGEGWRQTPEPTPPVKGDIYFVGCSFTYGAGVSDDETYVARLAKSAWSHYRLHNYSLGGYGTSHALVSVQKILSQLQKPKLILYGFIDNHLQRICNRRSYHESRNYSPFLSFDANGRSPTIATLNKGETVPDGPEIDNLEIQTARSLIMRMKDLCDAADVPFIMVILNSHDRRDIKPILDIPALHFIDIARATTRVFPHDGHPDAIAHLKIAHDIATDPRVAEWSGLSDLFQSNAFPAANQSWLDFNYSVYPKARKRIVRINPPSMNSTRARFSISGPTDDNAASVRLIRPLPALKRDQRYSLTVRSKSDRTESIRITIVDHDNPNMIVWVGAELELGKTDNTQNFRFRAALDAIDPALLMNVGNIEGNLEINDLKLVELTNANDLDLVLNPPQQNCKARLKTISEDPVVWRVDEVKSPAKKSDQISIASHGNRVIKGYQYRFTGRVRCDHDQRPFELHFFQAHPPYAPIAKYHRIEVHGPQWQPFSADWTSTIDDDNVTLQFNIGGSEIPMELTDLKLVDSDSSNSKAADSK